MGSCMTPPPHHPPIYQTLIPIKFHSIDLNGNFRVHEIETDTGDRPQSAKATTLIQANSLGHVRITSKCQPAQGTTKLITEFLE